MPASSRDGDRSAGEGERLPLWRRLMSGSITLLIVALVIFMWPATLGGSTRIVIVSGHSMEPTYDFGDGVIARGGQSPEVGDVVVFKVPEGTAKGILVIHRIIDVDQNGFFVTQGDNRDTPDIWQLTSDDIVGQPVFHLPKLGHVVWFLRRQVVIAVVLGLLMAFLLWPHKQPTDEQDPDERNTADSGSDRAAIAGVFELSAAEMASLSGDGPWTQKPIDQAVMDEAMAWLDEQLDGINGAAVH